jgi:hypothetical protein
MSMSNLGNSLETLGDYAGSRDVHKRVLEIRERVFGPEDERTLTSMNNLASSLALLGETDLTLKLFDKIINTRERVFGAMHPGTITARRKKELALDIARASTTFARRLTGL